MKPIPVNDAELAFGAVDIKRLMPAYVSVPDEFKNDSNEWAKFVSDMFFKGGSFQALKEKPGIDRIKAIRHFTAVVKSWEPKHEHKISGCAYLLSQWFEPLTQE